MEEIVRERTTKGEEVVGQRWIKKWRKEDGGTGEKWRKILNTLSKVDQNNQILDNTTK